MQKQVGMGRKQNRKDCDSAYYWNWKLSFSIVANICLIPNQTYFKDMKLCQLSRVTFDFFVRSDNHLLLLKFKRSQSNYLYLKVSIDLDYIHIY